MQIVYDDNFIKEAKKLPSAQQKKLASLLEILSENPFNPLLHTKRLSGQLAGYLSFRITKDWRVIFLFQDKETVAIISTKHRRDIYR